MAFLRKRGRPRIKKTQIDFGTRELQEKRQHEITTEPLDLCLRRGLITAEQHWAGIHFRWLHSMRFGAIKLHSMDPSDLGGIEHKLENPARDKRLQEEYQFILSKLQQCGLDRVALGLCIYNESPQFLRFYKRKSFMLEDERQLKKVKRMLNLLVQCFCQGYRFRPKYAEKVVGGQ